jgi:hypothetical protein
MRDLVSPRGAPRPADVRTGGVQDGRGRDEKETDDGQSKEARDEGQTGNAIGGTEERNKA